MAVVVVEARPLCPPVLAGPHRTPTPHSTLYRGCWVASAVACSTSAVELVGLTARFPNTRVSGMSASASASGWAIASPEAPSPPPPGDVEPLADAPGAVSLTSGRWSKGPRPALLSSSSLEESIDDDDGDGSSGRPSCLYCR